MAQTDDMFKAASPADAAQAVWQPLADRMRPQSLDEISGQGHLLAPDKPLYQAIEAGKLHSMIFWGPPGTGKTTLSRMIARYCDAEFISLSAVLSGVKDIRAAVDKARALGSVADEFSIPLAAAALQFQLGNDVVDAGIVCGGGQPTVGL